MAKQVLNRGAVADDPVADTLYDAAGKIVNNFDELYAHAESTANPHGVTAEQAGADPAGTAAAAVAAHESASDPHPQYLTEAAATTALAGKADLVGGVVPTAQIPALAVTEYLGSVASEAAMLALAGQKGDWAIRTDSATVWIITGDDPTQLADWTQLAYPTGNVSSVNGQTGVVVLSAADVGADPAGQNAPKASTFGVVLHGADANVARPSGYAVVYWIGTVSPVNFVTGDIWLNPDDPAPYTSADLASQAEAEAGTDNTKLMTPLRTAEAIAALGGGGGGGVLGNARLDIADAWYPTAQGPQAVLTLTQNQAYAIPYEIPRDYTLSDLGIWVSTAQASGTLLFGVARDDDSGLPGTVLLERAGVSASTTGLKKASSISAVSLALSAGDIVYFVIVGQGASGIAVIGQAAFDIGRPLCGPGQDPVSANPGAALIQAGFPGSLGASLAGNTWSGQSGTGPAILVKRA